MSPRDELYGQCPNCGNAIPRCTCRPLASPDKAPDGSEWCKCGVVPFDHMASVVCRAENPNHDLQKRRRGRKVQFSWGDVFNRHVAKGEDHASAAYAADEAEKRAKPTAK